MAQFIEGKGYQGITTFKNLSLKVQEAMSNVLQSLRKNKKNMSDKSYVLTRGIYLQNLSLLLTLQMNEFSSAWCSSCKKYFCWLLPMIKIINIWLQINFDVNTECSDLELILCIVLVPKKLKHIILFSCFCLFQMALLTSLLQILYQNL